jgi:DNA polymerase (family 10)
LEGALDAGGWLHTDDMTTLDATSVAALLREFGQRSALRGDNPFRAKAYARAADNLLTLTLSLEQIIAQERLREIPGVGEAIADIIKKLHATGTHPALEKMRKEIPVGVLEMLTVPLACSADVQCVQFPGPWISGFF